jgi:hypothetical protein
MVSQVAGPFLGGGSVPCSQTPGAQCGIAGSLYAAGQAPVDGSAPEKQRRQLEPLAGRESRGDEVQPRCRGSANQLAGGRFETEHE